MKHKMDGCLLAVSVFMSLSYCIINDSAATGGWTTIIAPSVSNLIFEVHSHVRPNVISMNTSQL